MVPFRFLPYFLLLTAAAPAAPREIPLLSADAQTRPGVPEGSVQTLALPSSTVYPGSVREATLYLPAQRKPGAPLHGIIFLDGPGYQKADGSSRATIVLDNLIAAGSIPPSAAIFVSPGTITATLPGAASRSIRSFEYDTPDDRCARFLADEVLPAARQHAELTTDPARWAICGISSSGIAAFTAAWERPDLFRNVISHIGSFTNIRGGHIYPALIRASRKNPKPIRVWMQEGENDLDNMHGHWPLANEDMAHALRWAGYEHVFTMTGGGHDGRPGGALLPDALRWAFQPPAKPEPSEQPKQESKPARHPDANPKPGVAQGTIHEMPVWKSTVFPGTERNWWVYVPAQYQPDGTAALMVFQDGHDYQKRDGAWGVPGVLDNLIAAGEIPPMLAVFLNPGHDPAKERKNPWNSSNRSLEYDSLGANYARFLADEILPAVARQWPFSPDPEKHGICGASSGGIASFTAAWERPDLFRRVLSTIGSFVNLRGGNVYPYLIRKTERKPLRIFLQDTSGDLDNPFGHWPTANRQMHAALAYMGYDTRFDWQEGYGHNSHRGAAIFPDAMRWLWRKDPLTTSPGKVKDDLAGDLSLNKLLIEGESWQPLADGFGFADGLRGDRDGNLYASDLRSGGHWRIAPDGSKTKICDPAGSGSKVAPDGRIVLCQGSSRQLIAVNPATGTTETLATDAAPNDLVIASNGWAYFTETGRGEIIGVNLTAKSRRTMATGLTAPNGIALSPDGGTLASSEYQGSRVWAWRIHPDGSLDAGLPIMSLRCPIDPKGDFPFNAPPPCLAASGGDGMCTDQSGRWYVTSTLGVQVFDPTGRACGLLSHPAPGSQVISCSFAGPGNQWLCVSAGNRIFRRKLNATGTP